MTERFKPFRGPDCAIDQLSVSLDALRQEVQSQRRTVTKQQQELQQLMSRLETRVELRGDESDEEIRKRLEMCNAQVERYEQILERLRKRERLVSRGQNLVDSLKMVDEECLESWFGSADTITEFGISTSATRTEIEALVATLEQVVNGCGDVSPGRLVTEAPRKLEEFNRESVRVREEAEEDRERPPDDGSSSDADGGETLRADTERSDEEAGVDASGLEADRDDSEIGTTLTQGLSAAADRDGSTDTESSDDSGDTSSLTD